MDLKANRRIVTAIEFISLAIKVTSVGSKAYENGRYGNDLDYSTMPDPRLKADEQAWIADYLKCKTQNGSA